MKKVLLTLSATIDELLDKVESTIYSGEDSASIEEDINLEMLGKIIERNELLKRIVTLSQFIPTDAEGKPIEKPIHIGGGIAEEAERKAVKAYEEAKAKCLFEGWRSFHNNAISHSNGDTLIFLKGRVIYDKKVGHEEYNALPTMYNPTLSDLAEATKDNPLPLT